MRATLKRHRSSSNANATDITSSITDVSKQTRVVKTQSPLRMLVEQLADGRKKLHLKGIDTIAIPSELYELTDLDVLDVTPDSRSGMNYTLSRVPNEFCFLINLKALHLDNNNIVSFPKEISALKHLEILTVSNNHITTLPDQMRELKCLRSCHLSNNKIEEMPLCLCYLSKSLLFLDLSYNYLKQLPANISKLKELRTLLLLGNRIRTLPDGLCQLSKLETLWLGDNRLKALPGDFYQLKQLDWHHYCDLSSNFEGNPLEKPPLAVCRQGMEAIEKFLKTKAT